MILNVLIVEIVDCFDYLVSVFRSNEQKMKVGGKAMERWKWKVGKWLAGGVVVGVRGFSSFEIGR